MSFGQATSSDGSPGSTDNEGGEREGEDVIQFEMDASGDHTAHQFNDSASSGGSYVVHRSHESLAEDETLSREEGTKNINFVSIFLTLSCPLKVHGSNTRRVTDLTVVKSFSSPHQRLEGTYI